MPIRGNLVRGLVRGFFFSLGAYVLLHAARSSPGAIQFTFRPIPFRVDSSETPARNIPETMAGGVAVFDYDRDGWPDLFFTNGANIQTLKKDSPKYRNRLFHNDGKGGFIDVTDKAGLAGSGFDNGVAAGDYNNDGFPDLFVAGVHRNSLYRNNGDGTFTDVTEKAGLSRTTDPEYGPLWAITGVWVDVNNDGLLDLFIVNYLQWQYRKEPLCSVRGIGDYCHPNFYQGQPNQLFLNKGDGTFEDISAKSGIRAHVGKGMGGGMADYDGDGRPDLFVTNDAAANFLFRNAGGNRFEEVAFPAGVALAEDGDYISGMGLDFRDYNNDGRPDIVFVALNNQTFPVFENRGGDFREVTAASGMRMLSRRMAGFGPALYDFDNDGWKDLFVSRGHVESLPPPGQEIEQHNTVFRNLGGTKWSALTEEAGFTERPPARHRGCAFGDFDGDGRTDVVVTALGAETEIWMNRTEGAGHWLRIALEGSKSNRDGIGARIKVVTRAGTQYNHMTSSVGYASSSLGPVHFGLGTEEGAESVEIRWPSGAVQKLENVRGRRVVKVKEPS